MRLRCDIGWGRDARTDANHKHAREGAKRPMPTECSVLVEGHDPRVVGLAGDDADAVPKRVARQHDPVFDA